MLAAIRVRGGIGTTRQVEATLKALRLYKRNHCALLEDSPEAKGMLRKAKDFVTWGEVNEETANLLRKKSAARYYCLNSPRKGFGRKGIKQPFSKGGALGYRKDINDLIRRML